MKKIQGFRKISRIMYIGSMLVMIIFAINNVFIPKFILIFTWIGIIGFIITDLTIHIRNLLKRRSSKED